MACWPCRRFHAPIWESWHLEPRMILQAHPAFRVIQIRRWHFVWKVSQCQSISERPMTVGLLMQPALVLVPRSPRQLHRTSNDSLAQPHTPLWVQFWQSIFSITRERWLCRVGKLVAAARWQLWATGGRQGAASRSLLVHTLTTGCWTCL